MTLDLDKLIADEDISYEESISKDPTNISTWISYYNFKSNATSTTSLYNKLFILYRSVKSNPTSIELWQLLIDLVLLEQSQIQSSTIIEVFETALISLLTNHEIWIQFFKFLLSTTTIDDSCGINKVTYIRRMFNNCLQSLPLVDHKMIWPIYLQFADTIGGITAIKIYLKYKQYLPQSILQGKEDINKQKNYGMNLQEIIDKLREFGDVENVMKLYYEIINNPNNYKQLPQPIVYYLFQYIDLLISSLKSTDNKYFEDLLTKSLYQYPDQLGKLYIKATKYFKSRGDIEKTRYYYNQGIKNCCTVKDFTMIYDSYLQFEENQVTKLTEKLDPESESEILSLYLDDFEKLINDRKILLNDMKLRQNINDLDTWFERFEIIETQDDLNLLIQTLTQALKSINPLKVTTTTTTAKNLKLSGIWLKYVDIYSSRGDFQTADLIFSKSVLSQYNDPDELAELYINWSEMILGCDKFPETKAIEILDDILYREYSDINYTDNTKPVQQRIIKSIKLWNFYIDLLETFIESDNQLNEIGKVINAYQHLIKLKIATPKIMINFAQFLESWNQFEQCFNVLHQALKIFQNDNQIKFEIWNVYLVKAIKHIQLTERIRDLFEQSINEIPAYLIKPILLLYYQYELDQGYTYNAIKILIKSLTEKFSPAQRDHKLMIPQQRKEINLLKFEIYKLILFKLEELQDIEQFNKIATMAMNDEYLSTYQLFDLGSRFIKFEISTVVTTTTTNKNTKNKQLERIRELFKFICQSTLLDESWKMWELFEMEHGDELSFKDMLRFKRTVINSIVNDKVIKESINPMGFLRATSIETESDDKITNPDIIDIDM